MELKVLQLQEVEKNAADVAVISLQNIAGTLDGTRKGAVVDTDYFNKERAKRAKRISQERKSEKSRLNTDLIDSEEYGFNAVVLRPGMNVQLRAGYSSDPNLLEVLISGRVTDMTLRK